MDEQAIWTSLRMVMIVTVISGCGGGGGGGSDGLSCDRLQLSSELTFRLSGQEIDWPSGNTQSIYETSGRYVGRNLIGTRFQIWKDEAYVALPRFKHGVPFSLASVSLKQRPIGRAFGPPRLQAYPKDWLLHQEGNCAALQNVVDLQIDSHRRVLWLLDSGIVNALEQPVKRCSPKILAFHLATRKMLKRVDLESLVNENSRLQHLAVEMAANNRTYCYVSDAGQHSLLIWDLAEDAGLTIKLPDELGDAASRDVLYLALVKNHGQPVLYFTYLGSERLYSLATEALRQNEEFFEVAPKHSKMVILGTDNASGIFFRNNGLSDVYKWDTETSFDPSNFILMQNGNDYRLPTHVVPGRKKLVWIIESNFHDYIENTVGSAGPSIVLHPIAKSCYE